MKSIIQLIHPETGVRSDPFIADAQTLNDKARDAELDPRSMVLILGHYDPEAAEDQLTIDFSTSPVFTIQSLFDSFEPNPEHLEEQTEPEPDEYPPTPMQKADTLPFDREENYG